MKTYQIRRDADQTGFSGTGHVADGVEFDDGTFVMNWRGPYKSTIVFRDLATAQVIHGHDGATRFVPAGAEPVPGAVPANVTPIALTRPGKRLCYLYRHACGHLAWWPAEGPDSGGCDACESGSVDVGDWQLLYAAPHAGRGVS